MAPICSKLKLKPLLLLIFAAALVLPEVVRSSPPAGDTLTSECLSVPTSDFVNSLESAIGVVRKVTGVVSQLGSVFGDSRLSHAIGDCLDLLDFSADELSWSASASQAPKSKHNGTGDLSSDLRTWLSAALSNQDTCLEGFDGTNSFLKNVVSGSLNQITTLVVDLLAQVHPTETSKTGGGGHGGQAGGSSGSKGKGGGSSGQAGGSGGGKGKGGGGHNFPSWVWGRDRKLLQTNGVTADVVVAQDGTGNFTKVQDAVMAAPDSSTTRFVIYVKKGVYVENVEIKKKKWNIMMVGDGMNATVISGKRSYIDGWTTFRSATFAVSGRGFLARDLTFENTAGPEKHQAVALRSDSDLSVFYRVGIRGYQDSLYTHTMRQFFRECHISGTVDFIFGDATAFFQNCQIQPRKGLPNQKNTITAQGRKDPNQPTGFSFQFCNVVADSNLGNTTPTYLGRPWKLYSRTVFMQSYLSSIIRPEGWLEWNDSFALDTLFYGEYMNYGPAAGVGSRVKWPGFHALNSSAQAMNYTVAKFIEGNSWLPNTGVTYIAGFGA